MRNATLSDYRWLYANGYMPDGLKCADGIMLEIVKRCPGTFLDYGCGRGQLVDLINRGTSGHAIGWDPATDEPMPTVLADWVVTCDVLEHIPRDDIGQVLATIVKIARKGIIATVANMRDAHHVSGEQVELHLIQEPLEWWIDRLRNAAPGAHVRGKYLDGGSARFAIVVDFA